MRSPWILAGLPLWLAASAGWAGCECLCLDGAPKTVCSSAEEMSGTGDLCYLRPQLQCPEVAAPAAGRSYPAPFDGVGNCRDAVVGHPASGDEITARVCDMRPND